MSTITIPQFEIGEKVIYIDTYHEYLNGKVLTVVGHNNNGYAAYKVRYERDYVLVTPFDIVKINY